MGCELRCRSPYPAHAMVAKLRTAYGLLVSWVRIVAKYTRVQHCCLLEQGRCHAAQECAGTLR